MKKLLKSYEEKKESINQRLQDFKSLSEDDYIYELFFCLLTPQSNAKKCWQAVEEIKQKDILTEHKLTLILKNKTRFHNNKAFYIMEALNKWDRIKSALNNKNRPELRNSLAENIPGLGMKEASHFLRNIGKSNNQLTILDRHILRNLKSLNIIQDDKIKNKQDYLNKEQQFIQFAKSTNIPLDSLDLLFWNKETGEIFK